MVNDPIPGFKDESSDRLKNSQATLEFIEKTDLYDKFQKIYETDIKDILSFDDFVELLIRLNGLVRGISIKNRYDDGENVSIKDFIDNQRLPKQKDKHDLLRFAYDEIDNLDKGDLKYFIPLLITGIHLFADGNGRTSRLFNLLMEKFDTKEKFEEAVTVALGEEGRYNHKDINPGKIYFDINQIMMREYGIDFESGGWPPILPKEFFGDKSKFMFSDESFKTEWGNNFYEYYKYDPEISFLAVFNYLKDKNLLSRCIESRKHELDYVEKALSPALMEHFLSDNDFRNIIISFFELLKDRIKILIKSFIEPDKYKLPDDTLTIREKILKEIE